MERWRRTTAAVVPRRWVEDGPLRHLRCMCLFEQGEKAMRRRFMVLGVVFGLILATVSGTHAAEMPSVDDLQAQMEAPAGTVTVYEPHLSVGDEHTAVDYVGYPAVDVMARLFGADWPSQAETVEFRALDGYVSGAFLRSHHMKQVDASPRFDNADRGCPRYIVTHLHPRWTATPASCPSRSTPSLTRCPAAPIGSHARACRSLPAGRLRSGLVEMRPISRRRQATTARCSSSAPSNSGTETSQAACGCAAVLGAADLGQSRSGSPQCHVVGKTPLLAWRRARTFVYHGRATGPIVFRFRWPR